MRWSPSDVLFRLSYTGALLFFLCLGWALVSAQEACPSPEPSTSPVLSPLSFSSMLNETVSSPRMTPGSPSLTERWDSLETLFETIISESEESERDLAELLERLRALQIEINELKSSGELASQRFESLELRMSLVIDSLKSDLEKALHQRIEAEEARLAAELRAQRMTKQALTFKVTTAAEAVIILIFTFLLLR
jgi:hypothetical protein